MCYAHLDAKAVYSEIRWLRELGVNIWYDEGISPGAEFPEYIGKAILGARLVLFYVSRAAARSRHCRDEVYFALDHDKPVLASYLTPTELPPGLALSLGTTQALPRHDMRRRDYRRKLAASISAHLAGSGEHGGLPAIEPGPWLTAMRRRAVPLAAGAVLALSVIAMVSAVRILERQEQVRYARYELLPEIRRLADERWRDYTEPYTLALQAEEIIPGDAELEDIFATISLHLNIDSEPAGAEVYMKDYSKPEDEWSPVGVTPIKNLRVPVGIFRWRFEKAGYEPVDATASSWDVAVSDTSLLAANHFSRTLDPIGSTPPGMVRVSGAETPDGDVPDFFIDRFEVTNAQYYDFVSAGGYRNRAFWKHEFVDDGRVLEWEEGIARFVDQSGRPGPASWIGGTYPEGEARHPVAVSWYEAAAYAEFVGRSLPSKTHWGLARGEYSPLIRWPQLGGYAVFAPFSNFGGRGAVEVGSLPGITAYGAYDLAGNVREWCRNDTPLGKLVRGGAWSDNHYRFVQLSQAPPMLREQEYGFRTVFLPDDAPTPPAVMAPLALEPPADLAGTEVVSDEVFNAYKRQFAYDRTQLDVRQESPKRETELWTLERLSVATAYGDERMVINLFLPKTSGPPYQTVLYFPGSGSLSQRSSEHIDEYYEFPIFLSFLVKTGRAVVYPVYQGTFDRSTERGHLVHRGPKSHEYTEFMVHLVKDVSRTIDYLETRSDLDTGKLAFYGMSWGSQVGMIVTAVEERLKTAIFLAGGLIDMGLPEVHPVNYLPRVTLPVLMLVGRYDTVLGHDVAAKPLFDRLGTPEEHKVMKVYETDHIPPKRDYIEAIQSWLDDYLGPVARRGNDDLRAGIQAHDAVDRVVRGENRTLLPALQDAEVLAGKKDAVVRRQ